MWAGPRERIKQTKLATILSVEVKPGIDGSEVYDQHLAGHHDVIAEHGMDDVRMLYEIWQKLR